MLLAIGFASGFYYEYEERYLFLIGSVLLLIIETTRTIFITCINEAIKGVKYANLILIIADNIVFVYWLVINLNYRDVLLNVF